MMAGPLRQWADDWSTETLRRWLAVEQLPTEEHQKALVALALQGTDVAGEILDGYDPRSRGTAHETFHKIARAEWEQRRKAYRARVA